MGFSLRLNRLMSDIRPDNFDNLYIPGFNKKTDDQLIQKYNAMKCASLLRETMWSMVSEITSSIEFDYKNYTSDNLSKFNQVFNEEFKIN